VSPPMGPVCVLSFGSHAGFLFVAASLFWFVGLLFPIYRMLKVTISPF
jgi:hypothetical protein